MNTDRINVLPAWFGDATDTPIDGRSTAGLYSEQQSVGRELVASQGIE